MRFSRIALIWAVFLSSDATAFTPPKRLIQKNDLLRIGRRVEKVNFATPLRVETMGIMQRTTRRSLLKGLLIGAGNSVLLPSTVRAAVRSSQDTASASSSAPLADLEMRRLRLPQPAVGREYVAIQLKIKGEGPFDFMVDSGLTTELITPHLQQTQGIKGSPAATVKGLAAGGDTPGGALVKLSDVTLCCEEYSDDCKKLSLPPLYAVVADFPQEHMDPAHDPVEGMLGMEMLQMFDVDFDFPKGRLRLWAPGQAASSAKASGLVEIPAVVLNETLLLGIRVTSAKKTVVQPVVGIIDCGASFSAVNWQAAELLGLPPKGDERYRRAPTIVGVGVDGRPQPLPTGKVAFTFCGDPSLDPNSGQMVFTPPPKSWKPWETVQVGVGDLPVFSELLGDGVTPFKGPAALIGLDVLSQRRVVLETSKDRRRRLFVEP